MALLPSVPPRKSRISEEITDLLLGFRDSTVPGARIVVRLSSSVDGSLDSSLFAVDLLLLILGMWCYSCRDAHW